MAETYPSVITILDDAALALLALSGVREICQGSASPTTGANATYTVTNAATRRVICFHLGATTPGAGDIRMRLGATAAAATHMPLIPQKYIPLYAVKDEIINFFNTTGDTIKVYVMEIA